VSGIDRRYSLFVVSSNLLCKNESTHVGRCQSNSCFSKSLAIEVLSKAEPISHLATQHQVSRKFLYQQGHKADEALDEVFSSSNNEQAVLFYVPVTQTWLFQLNKSVPSSATVLTEGGGIATGCL